MLTSSLKLYVSHLAPLCLILRYIPMTPPNPSVPETRYLQCSHRLPSPWPSSPNCSWILCLTCLHFSLPSEPYPMLQGPSQHPTFLYLVCFDNSNQQWPLKSWSHNSISSSLSHLIIFNLELDCESYVNCHYLIFVNPLSHQTVGTHLGGRGSVDILKWWQRKHQSSVS